MSDLPDFIDSNPNLPEKIELYFHCKKCIQGKPASSSAKSYARLAVGFTPDGNIQVWCNRHNINVALISGEDDE